MGQGRQKRVVVACSSHPLPPLHMSAPPTRRFRLPPLSSWWTGAPQVKTRRATLVSSCQSSCGSVTGPSFSPAGGCRPTGAVRGGPQAAIGQDAGGNDTHGGTRGVASSPSCQVRALASRQTPRLPPHIAAGAVSGDTSGTERRPRGTSPRRAGGPATRRKGGRSRVTTDHGEFASGLTSSLPRRLASLT